MLEVLLAIVALGLAVALAAVSSRGAAARAQLARASRTETSGSSSAEREALRLGRILAAMPDGVLVIERSNEVVFANPAAARLLGGDPVRIVPTLRAAPRDEVLLTVHHPVYREVRCLRAELDAGALLVVVRDVTEARRLDRMRQDFVANASHELKTPVSAIRATAETLRGAIEDDPAAARRFAETLGREAERLGALVQDLLDLARLDQETSGVQERCDASAVARDAVEQAQPRAADADVTLRCGASVADAAVPVRGADLALAIRNLLDNAIRHTSAGGSVAVEVARGDTEVRIEVRDTGDGIPAKDLPRIFERFYRVDRARSRDTGGTGLGLAIVKHIAEAAGGTVTASSVYGSGSTFTITLPLAINRD